MTRAGGLSVARGLTLIGVVVVALATAWSGFWLHATLTVEQPFDEIWIGTNYRMPTPLRQWACRTVRGRLIRPTLPPYGCQEPGEW